MEFARRIGAIPERQMRRLADMARAAQWRHRQLPDRDYYTAEVKDFWEPCDRAFFLCLPPGGVVHRHKDELIKGTTHHLVISTNEHCENWWMDNDERMTHMQLAARYEVRREPEHWSFNRGLTDRIHLLVEFGGR